MPHRNANRKPLGVLGAVALLLLANGGCTPFRTSSIPGMSLEKSDRQMLERVEKDPFPSPSDVGISAAE